MVKKKRNNVGYKIEKLKMQKEFINHRLNKPNLKNSS